MEDKENKERAQLWQQRVAQLKAGGMSQRAYAMEHGFSEHQVSYWVRRLTIPPAAPALLPVLVAPSPVPAEASMSLRSELGWTLTLPSDVPASWLAELMRAL
jgi:transposase-like protein